MKTKKYLKKSTKKRNTRRNKKKLRGGGGGGKDNMYRPKTPNHQQQKTKLPQQPHNHQQQETKLPPQPPNHQPSHKPKIIINVYKKTIPYEEKIHNIDIKQFDDTVYIFNLKSTKFLMEKYSEMVKYSIITKLIYDNGSEIEYLGNIEKGKIGPTSVYG